MLSENWVKIDGHTWRFEDRGVRFFLLMGDNQALLVDSGMTIPNARELAEELTDLPLALFNTHADRDHVAGNAAFERIYVSPCELVHPQLRGLTSTQVIPVWDGDIIDLGNRDLEAIALPGHTPGSMALLDRATGMLFAGDPIQRNGRIFMFGAMRSLAAYIHSLKRLRTRAGEISCIWPCHADCPVDVGTIGELVAGAEAVERGEVPYSMSEMHGTPIREYDVGVSTLLLDA